MRRVLKEMVREVGLLIDNKYKGHSKQSRGSFVEEANNATCCGNNYKQEKKGVLKEGNNANRIEYRQREGL
jgi:hypothetical protein